MGKKADNLESWREVTELMLPLSCPQPNEELWNKHPKVYLPIQQEGKSVCPYCGNKFVYISKDK